MIQLEVYSSLLSSTLATKDDHMNSSTIHISLKPLLHRNEHSRA